MFTLCLRAKRNLLLLLHSFAIAISSLCQAEVGLPLYYWQQSKFVNFGDYLSLKIVERIVEGPVRVYRKGAKERKLLALGSIFYFASDDDVIWGSGINGKTLKQTDYAFTRLDVRAVRGPLTREFLFSNFQIECPEVYGDPALLMPYLFPEFQKNGNPIYDYIIIPHYSEEYLYPKTETGNIVYPTDPWDEVIQKILNSKFVISSSLHGIIVAEAYGIPARQLRVSENEHIFKYQDYYSGTGRPYFRYASSVEEALLMGGEPPIQCDLKKLYEAFPFEFWQEREWQNKEFPLF